MSKDPKRRDPNRDEADQQTAADFNQQHGFAGPTPHEEDVQQQLLRVRADFENYKRRGEEERTRVAGAARTDVVLALLPVIDNFERAFQHLPKDIEKSDWYGGIKAIKAQFDQVLAGLGIERLPTVGEEFDPNLHEAISHEPHDEQPADHIFEELEAGYRHGDTVVRHARVKVSSGKE